VPAADFTDDVVLAKALSARDPGAFAYLVDRYHSPLVRLAQQYVPSRAIADEVVQETWLAIVQGIDRFEHRASLKTWMFKILVNIARSHGAKEHRTIPFASNETTVGEPAVDPARFRRFTLHARGTWKEPPCPWPGPEQRAIDADTASTVRDAIERLPPDQREVVTMRDVLGWSASEVCDALSITDGNQRVLLHRGRSKVRAVLERTFGEGRAR
jgi:RNA polymerase sigma-70 factor (ECF subfamily)